MKKTVLFLLAGLFCANLFCQKWALEERMSENPNGFESFAYKIVDAPTEYSDFIGTDVYFRLNDTVFDSILMDFLVPCEKRILEFLNDGNFTTKIQGEKKGIVFDNDIIDMKTKVSKEQLEWIWDCFQTKYVGYSEFKRKGLTRKKFLRIKNYEELKKLLDKYIDDCHFALYVGDFWYRKPTSRDEGCEKSLDGQNLYFEKETSNAYYVRVTNCTEEEYRTGFAYLVNKVLLKDYVVLDSRSNFGGDDTPTLNFASSLKQRGFNGTVVVLQDNFSFSSGEMWHVFGRPDVTCKTILVGTHSGGMNRFGNNMPYKNAELKTYITLSYTSFEKMLPENYAGEGKGYEPQIWATTPQMKTTLEGLGIDTADIEFK